MIKRSSAFLKISLSILGLYIVYASVFTVFVISRGYEEESKRVGLAVGTYMQMGNLLLKEGDVFELATRFTDAIYLHDIDFFTIYENGREVAAANYARTDEPLPISPDVEVGLVDTEDYRFYVGEQGPFKYVVGHKKNLWGYFAYFYRTYKLYFLKDIALVFVLVMGILLFHFRDFFKILRSLKARGLKRGVLSVANSSETAVLMQGIKGYETNIEMLSKENLVLKGLVLPALRREIFSGKKPPYEFACTLVRTDINGFTSIFSSDKRAQFMEVINEFFVDVTHVVSRYNGFVYEFIGDEVLFYFKDEDCAAPLESSAIAISAVRDIQEIAEKMNERTEAEYGYSFRVKSSLSYGLLRFGPLVDGYSLAGVPLIETVRLLSTVHEKSENVALMDDSVRTRIGDLCVVRDRGVVMLKGLPGARRTHIYQAHVPLSHHLRQERLETLRLASYYRSDAGLCEVLDCVRTRRAELDRERILTLLGIFRTFKATRPSVDVKAAYLNLLDSLLDEPTTGQEEGSFVLSTVISLAPQLFGKESFQGRLRERFYACLKIANKRIVANTLDVFAELDPSAGDEAFASPEFQGDNRIAANVLVKQAKKDWNKSSARQLKAMLKGKNPYFKASGLYALGEIARHLKQVDEVAFQADSSLQDLLGEATGHLAHANKMVRRQALRAIEKAGQIGELGERLSSRKVTLTGDALAEAQAALASSEEASSTTEGKVIDLSSRRIG